MSQTMEAKPMDTPLATGAELAPDQYPELYNFSGAFTFQFVPRPKKPKAPEFVYVDHDPHSRTPDHEALANIAQWNHAWEAAELRYQMFRRDIPKRWDWLKKFSDQNIFLLPGKGNTAYQAYAPLFHLLPRVALERAGLPLLKKGSWPYMVTLHSKQRYIPQDFEQRLRVAFARHVWPLLDSGSKKLSAFSGDDPLRLLAHNLDFWLPYVYAVAQNRLSLFDRVEIESERQARQIERARRKTPPEYSVDRPLQGGVIWLGEEEAWAATKELVQVADAKGQLRGIVDAIRSNRVADDFSKCWSYAREDFERKLFKKRSKIKISFVELDDTIPVHGPDSEVEEGLLWEDFMGVCDLKEKRIVVLLRNGTTKLGDISKELGYANHSPVSKALAKIRAKAEKMLE